MGVEPESEADERLDVVGPRLVRRVRRYPPAAGAGGDDTPPESRPGTQRGRAPGDRDEVWGDGEQDNDDRLRREVPPHHG